MRSTNPYGALKELESIKFNWLTLHSFKIKALLRKVRVENPIKIAYLKMWPSPSPAFICFSLFLTFRSCPFFFSFVPTPFGSHPLTTLKITSMQVPCTSMFLKIQTQISKHVLHSSIQPKLNLSSKARKIHSLCLGSKYPSHHQLFCLPYPPTCLINKFYSYYLFHVIYFCSCVSFLPTLLLLSSY